MADMFTKDKRSQIMSSIKSKDSRAEKIAFEHLRSNGIYFQRHYRRAPGCPDIALPRKKIAIFIDGDFWHGRDYERVLNVTKKKYWVDKIKRNIDRDSEVMLQLTEDGWTVLRVWESDLLRKRTRDDVLKQIASFLAG